MRFPLSVVVALALSITAPSVWGQAFTGTITGLVQDPNSASIPGVDAVSYTHLTLPTTERV